jgi:hypothetical protein
MHRQRSFAFSIIAAFGFALLSSNVLAQEKAIKEQLVGTWSFVSSNAKLPDGSSLWGENPKGLFIISENGYFSWQIFRSDRPKFASNNWFKATPAELETNNQGTLAYFGTYSVDEKKKVVTFLTLASTLPNSEGEVIKRIITKVTADELTYINPANVSGVRVEAVWKRAK